MGAVMVADRTPIFGDQIDARWPLWSEERKDALRKFYAGQPKLTPYQIAVRKHGAASAAFRRAVDLGLYVAWTVTGCCIAAAGALLYLVLVRAFP